MENNPQTFAEFWQNFWQMLVDINVPRLAGALLVLVVGWLLAVLLGNMAARSIRGLKLADRIDRSLPEGKAAGSAEKIEKIAGRVVFYVVLLLAVLGCLSTLNLSDAAEPVRDFVGRVVGYGLNLIAAGLLLFVAWIVASVLEYFALSCMHAVNIDEKLKARKPEAAGEAEAGKPAKPYSRIAANVIFWVTFLIFIPAVLRALDIDGITAPLEGMLAELFGFVPNLLAAAVILVVGLFAAAIVRKAVTGVLFIARLDELGKKAGGHNIFGEKGISCLAGLVAYVLVAIPVVISALDALRIEALTASVSRFFEKILNATGDVVGAGVLILAAFILGGVVAGIVSQLCEGFGFDRLVAFLGFAPKDGNPGRASAAVGKICFAAIMLFAVMSACEILAFHELAALVAAFLVFGGNIIVGIVVMMIGIYLANLAADALKGKGGSSEFLATVTRIAVLVFTGAIALSTLNLNGRIVEIAFALLLGAICVAAAIAFGLGGREFAAKKLEEWDKKLTKK